MNTTVRNSGPGRRALAGDSPRLPRRRFLGLCAALLGAVDLEAKARAARQAGTAVGDDAGARARGAAPRERDLCEADLYRPHDLAG